MSDGHNVHPFPIQNPLRQMIHTFNHRNCYLKLECEVVPHNPNLSYIIIWDSSISDRPSHEHNGPKNIKLYQSRVDFQHIARIARQHGFKNRGIKALQAKEMCDRAPYGIVLKIYSPDYVKIGREDVRRDPKTNLWVLWYDSRIKLKASTPELLMLKYIQRVDHGRRSSSSRYERRHSLRTHNMPRIPSSKPVPELRPMDSLDD